MLCRDDYERFARVCREITATPLPSDRGYEGEIGTYNEKRMHMILKRFVCEDESNHEIGIGARYIADVLCDGEIYEIQTGSLFPLKRKLEYYVESTDHHVTVVHPVAVQKRKIWIDAENGEMHPARRSRGRVEDETGELVYISELIATGRVSVWLLLIGEEEYRFLDGWSRDKKRGSSRYERLPVEIFDEIALNAPEDYAVLVPDALPECFTAAEYARAAGQRMGRRVYMALAALTNIGVLENAPKRGRASVWRRKQAPVLTNQRKQGIIE